MRRPFLDTNVLIYAVSTDPREPVARAAIEAGGVISVQCLNEFVNVMRGKLRTPWETVEQLVSTIQYFCRDVRAIDVETHAEAVRLAQRYGMHIYDATIVAAALGADCDVLLSEDMQDGLVVEGRLRIANPFVAR